MAKVDDYYQENSLGADQKKRELTKEEEKQVALIQKMIASPGYKIVHAIMTDEVIGADKKLWNKTTSMEDIRFYQGVIFAIQNVQSKILSLSKEEGYVRNT